MSDFRRIWMGLLVLVWGVIFVFPSEAVEKPSGKAEKSERTLPSLIEKVLLEGKEKKIEGETAQNLGLKAENSIKSLGCPSSNSPDKQGHYLAVVFVSSGAVKIEPTDLVWRVTKVAEKGGSKFIEGWGFRSSLKGVLQNAFWSSGEVGVEVTQEVKPIESEAVKRVFEKEKKFFLVDGDSCPLTK